MTDTTLQHQASRNCIPQPICLCRVPHHNTPLNPLSRGETPPLKPLISNKKAALQTSPLERGRGCVTYKHSLLNQKHPPKPRNTSSPNSSKNTSAQPTPLTVTHPLIPSREGKHPTQNSHYQEGNSISISPLERGGGCVTSAHSFLNPKRSPKT